MATVRPFRGLRYAPDIPLADVIAPPYDVIDSAAQNRYYERCPHNVIRLEYGKTFVDDGESNNRYTRAASDFQNWRQTGVLQLEGAPAFYLYEQEFSVQGVRYVRTGFIGAVKLEEYASGQILPHEQTLAKPKVARRDLMRACRANFSPVFGLFHDEENVIGKALDGIRGKRPPDAACVDEAGEAHRLWVITDSPTCESVSKFMSLRPISIADGHHRYETALRFEQEQAARGDHGCGYVLMTLVNADDSGMVVLPTHRLVSNVPPAKIAGLMDSLNKDFSVEPCGNILRGKDALETALAQLITDLSAAGEKGHAFGLCSSAGDCFLLKLKDASKLPQTETGGRSKAWWHLDVSILHHLILENLLGIGEEQMANQENLTYTRDPMDAARSTIDGAHQLAFFLNPTKVSQVLDVAQARDKMPQKSTFFYPKLITGLIINPLGEEGIVG